MHVLGLREMSNKSSKETLATFKEILNDIDSVIGEADSAVGNTILKTFATLCLTKPVHANPLMSCWKNTQHLFYQQYRKTGQVLLKVKHRYVPGCTILSLVCTFLSIEQK